MQRVLITGASGFIGRQCLPKLLETAGEVHAVGRGDAPAAATDVHWHEADLLHSDVRGLLAEIRPTHLLHMAWYAVPGKFWQSPENFRWVRATLDLLEAFAESGGQRVVVAGTCAEYDWDYGYCSEGVTPLRPGTTYGVCKNAVRSLVESYANPARLSWGWGRIFLLYGPHEHPQRLVSSVIKSLLAGEKARCSHGRQIRDLLHVDDVASAFVELLRSDVIGAVNIGSGQPVALRDVVVTIGDLIGRAELIELGAIPPADADPPLLLPATTRLFEEIGWKPRRPLREGLANTIEWWRQNVPPS